MQVNRVLSQNSIAMSKSILKLPFKYSIVVMCYRRISTKHFYTSSVRSVILPFTLVPLFAYVFLSNFVSHCSFAMTFVSRVGSLVVIAAEHELLAKAVLLAIGPVALVVDAVGVCDPSKTVELVIELIKASHIEGVVEQIKTSVAQHSHHQRALVAFPYLMRQ